MSMKVKYTGAAAILAAALLSGCATDISQTVPTSASAVEVLATKAADTTTEPTTTTTAKISITTTTTTETTTEETAETTPESSESTEDTTSAPSAGTYTIYSDEYKQYGFTDKYNDFLSKCVFVGDSICSGLKAYDIIPADRVCAVGNVAARNIFEDWVLFKIDGEKLPLLPALEKIKPEYIVFSMGMNDVNMTSEQGFCDNYQKILSQVESILPDSKLIVLSVTPITYGEDGRLFTLPTNIDSFNAALKDYLDSTGKWTYADVEHEMKNTNNMLKADYLGSPDGVHLAPAAYKAILYQLCERAVDGKAYQFDGSFTDAKAVYPIVTTAAETEPVTSKTKKTKETTTAPEEEEPILSGTLQLSDPD